MFNNPHLRKFGRSRIESFSRHAGALSAFRREKRSRIQAANVLDEHHGNLGKALCDINASSRENEKGIRSTRLPTKLQAFSLTFPSASPLDLLPMHSQCEFSLLVCLALSLFSGCENVNV